MSILAGAFRRADDAPIPESLSKTLCSVISRNPGDERLVFRDDRVVLVKVDINAYKRRAFRVSPTGSVSMMVGEPILAAPGLTANTRDQDLAYLHASLDRGDLTPLQTVRGVFCAVHYRPSVPMLTLIVDKLGIRSLFSFESRQYVIFATSLRILEALSEVDRELDLRGLTETVAFGYALGTRTAYRRIARLKAAEVVQVTPATITRSQYWRWDKLAVSGQPEAELLDEAYARFRSAITCRLRDDRAVLAFLTGGLDSRCVTAVLRDLDVTVHSINFAPRGTQDQALGAAFAQAAGAIHEEFPGNYENDPFQWLESAVIAWGASPHRQGWPVDRPHMIWDGNGGSVGLGHVYVHPSVVALLRQGKRDEAIAEYLRLERLHVGERLLAPALGDSLRDVLAQGMREELDDIHADAGRALHLFLMLNDQRCHMTPYLDNTDLHRLEDHLPFYDSHFLELILSAPIDLRLRHRFYNRWLQCFPSVVTSVPWQAYPTHEPCPLPIPEGLSYQWRDDFLPYIRSLRRRQLLQQARKVLASPEFPHRILNRTFLRAAWWAYRLGLRDTGHVLSAAHTYHRHWDLSRPAGRGV